MSGYDDDFLTAYYKPAHQNHAAQNQWYTAIFFPEAQRDCQRSIQKLQRNNKWAHLSDLQRREYGKRRVSLDGETHFPYQEGREPRRDLRKTNSKEAEELRSSWDGSSCN